MPYVLPTILALLATTQVTTPIQSGETLLEVEATGQSRLRPDTASMTIGVVSAGATAREASDANARAIAAVTAAVRRAGVGERGIQTQQISLQPRFARDENYGESSARITGYVARNSLSLTIERLAQVPDVIAAAYDAGANSVNGPNLSTADPAAGVADARADAIRNATAEAEAYARGLGLRVVRVIRLSERGSGLSRDIVVTGARLSSAGAAPPPPPPPAPPVPFSAGELRRTVQLWVDFALAR